MNRFIKHIASGIASLAIVGSCFVCAHAAPLRYGDVDSNSSVNSADALAVLNYCVGYSKLSTNGFKMADVNADSSVTSADALEILRYTVGSINGFTAETAKMPTTANAILTTYAGTVSNAKNKLPSYKYNSVIVNKDATAKISGLTAALLPADEVANLEKSMIDEINSTDNYTNIMKQGSSNSKNYLPADCTLTDGSKLKSSSCKVNADGNWEFEIKFNDEVNPTKSGTIVKALGAVDVDTLKSQLIDSLGEEDISVTLDSVGITYKNCYVKGAINPATNEIVKLDIYEEMYTSYKMSVLGVTTTCTYTTVITNGYTDFGY